MASKILAKMNHELLSFVVSRFWSMFSNFLFVPLYIGVGGLEAYAIIALSITINMFFSLFDAGFSPALIRTFATNKNLENATTTLKRFEIRVNLRGFLCLIIFFVCYFILNSFSLITSILWQDPLLILIILLNALSLLSVNLYRAALIGIHQGLLSNYSLIIFGFIKNILALFLVYINITFDIIFIIHILFSIIYRFYLSKTLLTVVKGEVLKKEIMNIEDKDQQNSLYIKQMMFLSIISVIITQAEKIFASLYLEETIFSIYFTISLISTIPFYISLPIFQYALPKMIDGKISRNQQKKNWLFLHSANILGIIACLFIYTYLEQILKFWIYLRISSEQLWFGRLYIVGTGLLILQLHPYFYQMRKGDMRTSLSVSIWVAVPMIISYSIFFFSDNFVLYACPWVAINLVVFFVLWRTYYGNLLDEYRTHT